jgi:beta-lactamase class A
VLRPRHLLPALLVVAGAAPVSASAAAPSWSPDVRAARAYADTRPGTVSFAVRSGGREWGSHGDRTVPAASLMKTLFLAAYLRRGDVRDRALTVGERRLLDPMIRRSDDVAAERVLRRVGHARLRRLARAAGLRDLALAAPVWGASRTSARDQALLFWRLDGVLPARHRAYAHRLLETVAPSQRWGLGRVALPAGTTLRFKGGWGSGTGAVDHQAALLQLGGGRRVALAITTTGNGSHAAGKATLRGVAARLLRDLR